MSSSSQPPSSEPTLPVEVMDYIIHLYFDNIFYQDTDTAEQNNPECPLLLVCTRFHEVANPLRLRRIFGLQLNVPGGSPRLSGVIRYFKKHPELAQHVKALGVYVHFVADDDQAEIVKNATRLRAVLPDVPLIHASSSGFAVVLPTNPSMEIFHALCMLDKARNTHSLTIDTVEAPIYIAPLLVGQQHPTLSTNRLHTLKIFNCTDIIMEDHISDLGSSRIHTLALTGIGGHNFHDTHVHFPLCTLVLLPELKSLTLYRFSNLSYGTIPAYANHTPSFNLENLILSTRTETEIENVLDFYEESAGTKGVEPFLNLERLGIEVRASDYPARRVGDLLKRPLPRLDSLYLLWGPYPAAGPSIRDTRYMYDQLALKISSGSSLIEALHLTAPTVPTATTYHESMSIIITFLRSIAGKNKIRELGLVFMTAVCHDGSETGMDVEVMYPLDPWTEITRLLTSETDFPELNLFKPKLIRFNQGAHPHIDNLEMTNVERNDAVMDHVSRGMDAAGRFRRGLDVIFEFKPAKCC